MGENRFNGYFFAAGCVGASVKFQGQTPINGLRFSKAFTGLLLTSLFTCFMMLQAPLADAQAVPAKAVDQSEIAVPAKPLNAASKHQASRKVNHPPILTLKDCLKRVLAENPAILAINFNLQSLQLHAQAIRESYLPQLIGVGESGFIAGSSTNAFSVIGVQEPSIDKTINKNRVVITPHTTSDLLSELDFTTTGVQRQLLGLNGYREGGGRLTMPLINSGSFFGINTPPAATEKYMEKEATMYAGQLTTQQVIYGVTNAYLNVVNAEHKLELLKRDVILSNKLLEITRAQLQFGISTQFDVDAATTTLAEADQAYMVDEGMSVQAFLELSQMLGVQDPKSFCVDTRFPAMPDLPTYSFLLSAAQDHQPSVLQQEAIAKEAKAQLAFDQSRIYPTLNYEGDYSYGDDWEHKGNTEWSTFLTLNVPIWDFGVLSNTAKADVATLKADELQVKASQDTLIQDLYSACGTIRDNTAALSAINSQVASAYKAQQKDVILGQVDGVTLLTAINDEQAYVRLRLTQEDQILHDILAYAELQEVLAGRWNWLEHPTNINPSNALPVDQFKNKY